MLNLQILMKIIANCKAIVININLASSSVFIYLKSNFKGLSGLAILYQNSNAEPARSSVST